MNTELAKFVSSNNLPTLSDDALADAIEKVQSSRGGGSLDARFQFLKFNGKTGRYALGKDGVEMDPEAVYIVEPMSFTLGWICWKNGAKVGEHEWSYFRNEEDGVLSSELADHGPFDGEKNDGWKPQSSFKCMSIDGERTDIKFQSSTLSAVLSIADLLDEIKDRARAKEPAIPIIHFKAQQFVAQGNKNEKPVFPVEAWATRAGSGAFVAGDISRDELIAGVEKSPKKK